jgi:ABC-2 type transport system permease protein
MKKTNRTWAALRGMTIASMKMYFRNKTALFFSLFFPIVFIVVFGLIFNHQSSSFKVDVVYQNKTPQATSFVDSLGKNVSALKFTEVTSDQAATDLNKGNSDLALTIPATFGTQVDSHPAKAQILAQYSASSPQTGLAAVQIVSQFVSIANDSISHTPQILTLRAEGVNTKNLSYIDFLLPGMVGLSVMQLGIFSVAFAFVSYKSTGMLRRIQATPVHPGIFLFSQGFTRLIMAVLQTAILVTIGTAFFSFHLSAASYLPFVITALLGSIIFMAIGFAIAGWAKNEDQAQPVAQLIQFPMMFLSGTFFPRDGFPHVLQVITGFLPLTFLTDGLRDIANNGAGLWAIRSDLLGLLVWAIVAGAIAVRLFHWE